MKARARESSRRRRPRPPIGLTDVQRAFVLEYLANNYNATEAYLACHPKAKRTTAAAEGYRYLRNPEIATFMAAEKAARLERLRMDGDEALSLIALSARADIREAFDSTGKMLPLHSWPPSLRLAVKGIKPGPFGDTILLHDGLKARELMAIAGGKLRAAVDLLHSFDHVGHLAALSPLPKGPA